MTGNTLLLAFENVAKKLDALRVHACEFYFEVLLSLHPCRVCGRKMCVTHPSQWTCACGANLDPTVEFQRSECCNAPVAKQRSHYACTQCGAYVPSQFLFDERIFDAEYFRVKMEEHRQNQREKREMIRQLLANSHSNAWTPAELNIDATLFRDLDDSIEHIEHTSCYVPFVREDVFQMEQYRQIILRALNGASVWFDGISAVTGNFRVERARRFITLVFMQHCQEVWLEERNKSILVKPYETYD